MIEIKNVTKNFGGICAVNQVTLDIPEGVMYGLLGTNGAGKSTLLRLMSGILKPDGGEILLDKEPCYDNPECKRNFFYLSDTPYYFPNTNMEDMVRFYQRQYPEMDTEGAAYMAESLNLDMRSPLRTFSKGMKRQAFLIIALCTGTKYLLCDEVFDGLDPIVTEVMKNLFGKEMEQRKFTVVVASHKLQDLEDICRHIGILHKGGILQAGEMREQAGNIHKFQCVFADETGEGRQARLAGEMDVVRYRRDGYFTTLIARGDAEEIRAKLCREGTVFCKDVDMTLEEIFIAQMEEAGYDIGKVLC